MDEILIEKSGEIPFGELDIRQRDIWLGMGYRGHTPPQEVLDYLAVLEKEAEGVTRARYCFRVYRNGSLSVHCPEKPDCGIGENLQAGSAGHTVESLACKPGCYSGMLSVGGVNLCPGEVIYPIAAEAEYECIFTASSGMEFHRWLKDAGASGDIMRQFTADCIGSEIAEAAARYAADRLVEVVTDRGWTVGNSYSPGYCGWNVTEQRKMFSLLPEKPCGITLNDSCLMTPVKSVSGIIPVGPGIVKKRYSCAVCPRTDCFKKLKLKR